MIGLDTNVLVRYITQDDPVQSLAATKLIEGLDDSNKGFVSIITVVELHWVLCRAYKVPRAEAVTVIRTLLAAQELSVQEPDCVHRTLTRCGRHIDFSDALISELGLLAGCDYTATFDRAAAALPGMRSVPDTRH